MNWTNRETEVFNLHYQDVVMVEFEREHPQGTGSEEDVKEIVKGIIDRMLDEVTLSGNTYIIDVVNEAIDQVNTKELIEAYYYDYEVYYNKHKEKHKK